MQDVDGVKGQRIRISRFRTANVGTQTLKWHDAVSRNISFDRLCVLLCHNAATGFWLHLRIPGVKYDSEKQLGRPVWETPK
ncbi:hypothetical protein CTI12_AA217440 [Artemisia annua]|uniref:Uncharacterized protein n=1 Tax=Artemisia annua TaxID=35608 RepID=A0A2U1NXP0_ARTAN|nr:hypothetical protein CTI12_AA217440 [Artemisia annua]